LDLVVRLFSIFEPCSITYTLSFTLPFFFLGGVISPSYLVLPCMLHILYYPSSLLKPELDVLLTSTKCLGMTSLFYRVWVLLLILNFSGLFPYVLTLTRHISLSTSLALTLWVTFLLYGWTRNPFNMLIALVPNGTPLALIPLIVIIESIRIIIRPITLSVRLSANIIAGHLLLRLCAMGCESFLSFFLTFLCQTMLMLLEVAVAAIQAYVFIILISLYSKETSIIKLFGIYSILQKWCY